MMVGAIYHQIGNPTKMVSYSSMLSRLAAMAGREVRIAHFDGAAGFLVHPVQIGLGVWNFRLNLKNVCTDGISQIFSNFCGNAAGRKVSDKSFAHGNALPLDDFV